MKVNTVLGPIEGSELGPTMSHVHHTINLLCWYQQVESGPFYGISQKKLSMDILGIVRRNGMMVKDNLILDDLDLAIKEFGDYVISGGKSAVNVDLPGMGRDVLSLQKISRATGANIIASTGWYTISSHPPYVSESSVEELRDIMVKEITEGIDGTDIKAGNIGELAMSGMPDQPFFPDEEKVLRAGAQAQAATGVSLTVHPNFLGNHWDTYLDVLEEEGADLSRCYMSHCGMYTDIDVHLNLLERGVGYLSFDQLGHEELFETTMGPGVGFSTDRDEINSIVKLINMNKGYENRIIMGNEIAFKSAYKAFGGYGYSHIFDNVVPWLKSLGITNEQIKTMIVDNPRRLHCGE